MRTQQEHAAHKLSRWEGTFGKKQTEAPPGGWKKYLRDGWSTNIDMWRERYRRYLKSWAWKQKRQGAIRRAEGKCAVCEQPSKRLDVHHVDYMRVGIERVEDLRVVCRSCHGVIHTMKRQPNIPMNELQRAHALAREYRQRAKDLRHAAMEVSATGSMPTKHPTIRRRPKIVGDSQESAAA